MGSTDRPLPDVPGSRPDRRRRGFRWLWAAGLAVILAAAGLTAAHLATASSPSPRDQRWQGDVADLARELPFARTGGLGPVSRSAWNAAAARLEAQVPRLTNGQIIVGMARLVAMLHDDETELMLPPQPTFTLEAQYFGRGLYLLAVPRADRNLLGARLLAVDGMPVAQVLARIRPVIDAEDLELRTEEELGSLDEASLLHWLGVTPSPTSARFTVVTAAGHRETVRLTATGSGNVSFPDFLAEPVSGMAGPPVPLYLQHRNLPYWLQVLPAQHAVFLKYNQCRSDDGFQRLAAQALAVLRAHPGDRLIVDLRDNFGGNSSPFHALIAGIQADPAINRPGRVIGLVNDFTDSAAKVDVGDLAGQTRAVLIGTGPADPIDEYGDDDNSFGLPASGLAVQYTTKLLNPSRSPSGIPSIKIAPTLHQVLAGDDPVLAGALSYRAQAREAGQARAHGRPLQ
jgi:hypothetical protein